MKSVTVRFFFLLILFISSKATQLSRFKSIQCLSLDEKMSFNVCDIKVRSRTESYLNVGMVLGRAIRKPFNVNNNFFCKNNLLLSLS